MSTDPSETLCFCFGHDRRAILAASDGRGGNAIVDSITAACRAGRSRCAELNPSGRCCLGEIRAVVREAAAGSKPEDSPDPAGAEPCCGPDDERP